MYYLVTRMLMRDLDEIEPCLPGLPCDENGIESGESDENGWG